MTVRELLLELVSSNPMTLDSQVFIAFKDAEGDCLMSDVQSVAVFSARDAMQYGLEIDTDNNVVLLTF